MLESYRLIWQDVAYEPGELTVRALDKDGNLCPRADTRLYFSCEGCGEYLAADNGDQTEPEIFSSPTRKAFSGMAVGIFRTLQGKSGELLIHVRADGMADATVTATVQ